MVASSFLGPVNLSHFNNILGQKKIKGSSGVGSTSAVVRLQVYRISNSPPDAGHWREYASSQLYDRDFSQSGDHKDTLKSATSGLLRPRDWVARKLTVVSDSKASDTGICATTATLAHSF